MRDISLLLVLVCYAAVGMYAPFVLGLGYLWTDIFSPQSVGWSFIQDIPMSKIMAILTIVAYFAFDRTDPPRLRFGIILIFLLAFWITLTTTWAVMQGPAWVKWDTAIKTLLFSCLVPYLFRSRVQIEAMILTFCVCIIGTVIPYGAKIILSGGSYGAALGLYSGNAGLAESSTLAMLSIVLIPLIMFISRHSLIIPPTKYSRLTFLGIGVLAVFCSLGTYARTGLVSTAILFVIIWLRSKHKVALAALAVAAGVALPMVMGASWTDRMSTITAPVDDTSAAGRLAVWLWTLDYVVAHPLGGGFSVYLINRFDLNVDGETVLSIEGKAFHSIWFEVLGEHGFVGILIFLAIIVTFFVTTLKLYRKTKRNKELEWLNNLSLTLMIAMIIYLCGGSFVGVAFQPTMYYFLGAAIAADEYYERRRRATLLEQEQERAQDPRQPGPMPVRRPAPALRAARRGPPAPRLPSG